MRQIKTNPVTMQGVSISRLTKSDGPPYWLITPWAMGGETPIGREGV